MSSTTIGELINSETSLINKNHDTWKAVLTLTKISYGASSQGQQTMTINVTNLPAGGANYRVYKTTANGNNFFSDATALTAGTNTVNVSAVTFNRAVKIQFSSHEIEFDSLTVNGVSLYSGTTEPEPEPEPEPVLPDSPSWGHTQFANIQNKTQLMYGIGFAVQNGATQNAYQNDDNRLHDALNKVGNLGYNVVRTWGYNEYSLKTYENIKNNNRDIKVQQGLYINTSDLDACKTKLDTMMTDIAPYHEHVFAISLLNETEHTVTASTLEGLIDYFHSRYGDHYKVTANFLAGTLNNSVFANVFNKLDFVNVNEYGGYFGYGESHTHDDQVEQLQNKNYSQVPNDKMIVIGETGWQHASRGGGVTAAFDSRLTPANAVDYYRKITHAIYKDNSDTRFTFMFYFNLTNASWKSPQSIEHYNKDNWGLFQEGNGDELGPLVHLGMGTTIDILKSNPEPTILTAHNKTVTTPEDNQITITLTAGFE